LFFGAAKSGRAVENMAKVERFAPASTVLPCGLDVAREYGNIRERLRNKGRPIPENDIWIAATAMYHELQLASRDRHFLDIEGLSTVRW